MLAVREKLQELRRTSDRDLSKPDKDQSNEMKRRLSAKDDDDVNDDDHVVCDDVRVTSETASPVTQLSSDRQQQLVVKCVKLLTQKHFLEVASNVQVMITIALAMLLHCTVLIVARRPSDITLPLQRHLR